MINYRALFLFCIFAAVKAMDDTEIVQLYPNNTTPTAIVSETTYLLAADKASQNFENKKCCNLGDIRVFLCKNKEKIAAGATLTCMTTGWASLLAGAITESLPAVQCGLLLGCIGVGTGVTGLYIYCKGNVQCEDEYDE